jgi:hypothetical protein
VEAFYYRNKKAQARRSSHGTDGSSSEGPKKSHAGSETQELLMLLHHLATSTSSGAIGVVTQSSVFTASATASQFSILGLTFTPSPYTYYWYLDSDAFFHMTVLRSRLPAYLIKKFQGFFTCETSPME